MSATLLARSMPRLRKITITAMICMSFTNSILVAVTLVRPVPQFSSSGALLAITAGQNVTLSRRGIMASQVINDNDGGDGGVDEQVDWYDSSRHSAYQLDSDELRDAAGQLASHASEPTGTMRIDADTQAQMQAASIKQDIVILPSSSTMTTTSHPTNVAGALPTARQALLPPDSRSTAFVEIWIGPLGVCIRRGNGSIACSGLSILPKYRPVYDQAGLNEQIKDILPQSLSGSPVSLLLGAMAYIVCTVIFGYTLAPRFSLVTPSGYQKSMDSRHQLALSLNTIFATLALFLIIIPTFVMRGSFLKSVNAIPAFDTDLTATLGDGFVQLYTACVLGGLIIVQCIALISEDLRYPWWFVYNAFKKNPYQSTFKGIDYTARTQIKLQEETRVAIEAEMIRRQQEYVAAMTSGDMQARYAAAADGRSIYAPTILPGMSEAALAQPSNAYTIPTSRSAIGSAKQSHRVTTMTGSHSVRHPLRETCQYYMHEVKSSLSNGSTFLSHG